MTRDRITIEDIRAAGHCVLGARDWFRQHGLSFAEFLRDGADAEVLLATGDALAERVVTRARERADG